MGTSIQIICCTINCTFECIHSSLTESWKRMTPPVRREKQSSCLGHVPPSCFLKGGYVHVRPFGMVLFQRGQRRRQKTLTSSGDHPQKSIYWSKTSCLDVTGVDHTRGINPFFLVSKPCLKSLAYKATQSGRCLRGVPRDEGLDRTKDKRSKTRE